MDEGLLEVLRAAAGAVRGALDALEGWGPAGADAVHPGQYRSDVAAAALDLCAVAAGRLDAYVDFSFSAHGPWDYLGGMLVCQEAGASVADAFGRDLLCRGHGDRRTPVAAATPELLAELVALRTETDQ